MNAALLLVLVVFLAAPATAQVLDPGAGHRADMERQRALSDVHAAGAASYRAGAAAASLQVQAAVRTEAAIGAAQAGDAELRAQARRQEELRLRAEQDAALELERRLRNVGAPTPR